MSHEDGSVVELYERWERELVVLGREPDMALVASLEATAATEYGVDLLEVAREIKSGLVAATPFQAELHPRGRDGKFIEKLGLVNLFNVELTTPSGKTTKLNNRRAQVTNIRPDPKRTGKVLVDVMLHDESGKPTMAIPGLRPDQISSAPKAKATLNAPEAPELPQGELGYDDLGDTPVSAAEVADGIRVIGPSGQHGIFEKGPDGGGQIVGDDGSVVDEVAPDTQVRGLTDSEELARMAEVTGEPEAPEAGGKAERLQEFNETAGELDDLVRDARGGLGEIEEKLGYDRGDEIMKALDGLTYDGLEDAIDQDAPDLGTQYGNAAAELEGVEKLLRETNDLGYEDLADRMGAARGVLEARRDELGGGSGGEPLFDAGVFNEGYEPSPPSVGEYSDTAQLTKPPEAPSTPSPEWGPDIGYKEREAKLKDAGAKYNANLDIYELPDGSSIKVDTDQYKKQARYSVYPEGVNYWTTDTSRVKRYGDLDEALAGGEGETFEGLPIDEAPALPAPGGGEQYAQLDAMRSGEKLNPEGMTDAEERFSNDEQVELPQGSRVFVEGEEGRVLDHNTKGSQITVMFPDGETSTLDDFDVETWDESMSEAPDKLPDIVDADERMDMRAEMSDAKKQLDDMEGDINLALDFGPGEGPSGEIDDLIGDLDDALVGGRSDELADAYQNLSDALEELEDQLFQADEDDMADQVGAIRAKFDDRRGGLPSGGEADNAGKPTAPDRGKRAAETPGGNAEVARARGVPWDQDEIEDTVANFDNDDDAVADMRQQLEQNDIVFDADDEAAFRDDLIKTRALVERGDFEEEGPLSDEELEFFAQDALAAPDPAEFVRGLDVGSLDALEGAMEDYDDDQSRAVLQAVEDERARQSGGGAGGAGEFNPGAPWVDEYEKINWQKTPAASIDDQLGMMPPERQVQEFLGQRQGKGQVTWGSRLKKMNDEQTRTMYDTLLANRADYAGKTSDEDVDNLVRDLRIDAARRGTIGDWPAAGGGGGGAPAAPEAPEAPAAPTAPDNAARIKALEDSILGYEFDSQSRRDVLAEIARLKKESGGGGGGGEALAPPAAAAKFKPEPKTPAPLPTGKRTEDIPTGAFKKLSGEDMVAAWKKLNSTDHSNTWGQNFKKGTANKVEARRKVLADEFAARGYDVPPWQNPGPGGTWKPIALTRGGEAVSAPGAPAAPGARRAGSKSGATVPVVPGSQVGAPTLPDGQTSDVPKADNIGRMATRRVGMNSGVFVDSNPESPWQGTIHVDHGSTSGRQKPGGGYEWYETIDGQQVPTTAWRAEAIDGSWPTGRDGITKANQVWDRRQEVSNLMDAYYTALGPKRGAGQSSNSRINVNILPDGSLEVTNYDSGKPIGTIAPDGAATLATGI